MRGAQESRGSEMCIRDSISHYSQVSLSCEAGVFKVILATAVNKNKLNISARVIAKLDGTS